MTADQLAIVAVAVVGMATAAVLWSAAVAQLDRTRGTGPAPNAPTLLGGQAGGVRSGPPDTVRLRDLDTIPMPSSRPYTGGIPVLDDAGQTGAGAGFACSLCNDGALPDWCRPPVGCVWCGRGAAVAR